jgi:hypothetical protein
VIVSANECNESMSKSPNLQSDNFQQDNTTNNGVLQSQNKTFFTTLNLTEQYAHRNINEFINRCENDNEGFNFLQDSEIQSRQQAETIQNQQQNEQINFQTHQQSQNINFNPNEPQQKVGYHVS